MQRQWNRESGKRRGPGNPGAAIRRELAAENGFKCNKNSTHWLLVFEHKTSECVSMAFSSQPFRFDFYFPYLCVYLTLLCCTCVWPLIGLDCQVHSLVFPCCSHHAKCLLSPHKVFLLSITWQTVTRTSRMFVSKVMAAS